MANRKLDRSLRKFKNKKEDKVVLISGELGIPLNGSKTVEVPGRPGFVFVRLRGDTSELIQAYNSTVAAIYGLPVLVARQVGVYKVIGRNIDRYTNQWTTVPFLPKHGSQHSFNPSLNIGGDIVWVYSQQFMPLLGYPSGTAGSPTISIAPYLVRDLNGNWKYAGNTGTPSTALYNPNTGSRALMALVYIDTVSGNPYLMVNSGTYFDETLTGTNQVAPYIPQVSNPNHLPIAAIRLVSGTSTLTWNNVYDVRPFLQVIPTGSGAGSFTFNVWDEGIPLGTAQTLNVVGNLVDITISGSVARLFVTGSSPSADPFDLFWTSGSNGRGIRSKSGNVNTLGPNSFAIGDNTLASGTNSVAIGANTKALGENSFAMGSNSTASGAGSFARGSNSVASGDNTTAEGTFTTAAGGDTHAEGSLTSARGSASHAEGVGTYVSGTASHVTGQENTVIADHSTIVGGYQNQLYGNRSVMLGGQAGTGTLPDAVYLNGKVSIKSMSSGTPTISLGLDTNGFVVTGTSVVGQILSTTGTTPAVTGYAHWHSEQQYLLIYDGRADKGVTPIGWQPYAYQEGYSPDGTIATTQSLTANGGSVAIPIHIAAPMLLSSVTIWNWNSATQRTWGWDLYAQLTNSGNTSENVVKRIARSDGNETFTPAGAASARDLGAANAPVSIPPGSYWLVIQCRHATNNIGLGTVASNAFARTTAKTQTTPNPNGDYLNLVTGTWSAVTYAAVVRMNGWVLGQTGTYS